MAKDFPDHILTLEQICDSPEIRVNAVKKAQSIQLDTHLHVLARDEQKIVWPVRDNHSLHN